MTTSTASSPQRTSGKHKQQKVADRKQRVSETLSCPYCDAKLEKWHVPDSPFNEWPSEFQYICFNDDCCYFVGGWSTMEAQGLFGSYRFMYDPPTGGCHAVSVLTQNMLKDGIVGSNA
jgi:hypothetical protein